MTLLQSTLCYMPHTKMGRAEWESMRRMDLAGYIVIMYSKWGGKTDINQSTLRQRGTKV